MPSVLKSAAPNDPEAVALKLIEDRGGTVTRSVEIDLTGKELTDAGLKELAGLKDATSLYLGGTKVSDAGVEAFASFPKLTSLTLTGTSVTDAGLKALIPFQNLTELNVGPKITDVGLKELAKLKNLQVIRLDSNSPVTDAGESEFRRALPRCLVFFSGQSLSHGDATPRKNMTADQGRPTEAQAIAFIEQLGGTLKREVAVDLSATWFDDADVETLTGLRDITMLSLEKTQLTDHGLQGLTTLQGLRELRLGTHSRVTAAAESEFVRRLPDCVIWRERIMRCCGTSHQ